MITLLPQQSEAIKRLRQLKVGANFAEPGTGKTRSTIELIRSTPCSRVLWITPCQTRDNLLAELNRWGGLTNVFIVGSESLSSSSREYLNAMNYVTGGNTFIVVDESLKIKNWEAIRTKRIVELGRHAEFKMILNGTPVSRNLLDLWAQFEFLSPKILGMPLTRYKNTYCEYTVVRKSYGGQRSSQEYITGHRNIPHLYSLIAPYVYECDLKLDIGRQYYDIPYSVDPESRRIYTKIRDTHLTEEALQRLNNNIFLQMTAAMQHVYCCTPGKFEALEAILSQIDRRKVVIFRRFVASEKAIIERHPDMRVLSIQSHAFGLNLQEYNAIIIWDKVWDYALLEQMERRIYRVGQKSVCRYYDLTGDVKLESMMRDNVAKKGQILKQLKSCGYANVEV